MSSFPPQTGVVVLAAMSIATGMFFATARAFPAHQAVQVFGLVVVAMLTSLLPRQKSAIEDRRTLPLSFVVAFTSLLLLGPNVATFVAAAGPFARWVMDSERRHNSRRMVVNVATVMTAIQVAGLVHRLFGGTSGHFVWPWQAFPLAAAVLGYCVVTISAEEVLVPLLKRQPMPRAWPASLLLAVPECVVAASVAVVIVELIDQRRWDLLLVAAVPVCLAYRGHWAFLSRFQDEQRQHEIIDSFEEGMCVLDSDGRVTLWSDTAERIIGCSRERALGCLLVAAVPALRKSELPRSINEVLTTGNPGSLANVALPSPTGTRMVQVKILPVVGGVTLLWQDVTERRRAEHVLKRNEERFALAAEGAHDGLWEWDVRAEEFYFSGRWRALLGLPATPGVGRPEDWIDRVHEDDRVALQEAIDAHLTGKTDHLVHEHRIRHEDGTYRPVLCRGVAVKGPGRGGARIAGSLRDTTDRSMAEDGMHNGFVDSLTGLSNRAVFVRGLGRRLDERKQRRGGSTFAVLYLDLDRFKLVNDSLGHLVGDELLIAASRRLETCLRPGDALARLGGDEFAILLGGLGDEQQANAIEFRIHAALSAPFSICGREVLTTASIGIACGLAHYTNAHEMMRDADTAMYHAKSRGKARHELFDADMHARARDRLGLESDLRHAVSTNDFEVHYQP
ncbi:MAG: diguanylate cyclase, partial [Acidobacteria bacterium]|nr:diguanylate cyclase [Acidobacteriota bacterium]